LIRSANIDTLPFASTLPALDSDWDWDWDWNWYQVGGENCYNGSSYSSTFTMKAFKSYFAPAQPVDDSPPAPRPPVSGEAQATGQPLTTGSVSEQSRATESAPSISTALAAQEVVGEQGASLGMHENSSPGPSWQRTENGLSPPRSHPVLDGKRNSGLLNPLRNMSQRAGVHNRPWQKQHQHPVSKSSSKSTLAGLQNVVPPNSRPGSGLSSTNEQHNESSNSSNNNLNKTARASLPMSLRGRNAIFPAGDARNGNDEALLDIRTDMMVNWLYEQQLRKQYATGMDPFEGVVLKKARGSFTCCPSAMAEVPGSLFNVVVQMNVRCAMTVNTPAVSALLNSLRRESPTLDYVPLPDGLRVQILATLSDLPRGQLHHFAAFIEDIRMLVVWDDEPEKLLARAVQLEILFMGIIWTHGDDEDGEAVHDPSEKEQLKEKGEGKKKKDQKKRQKAKQTENEEGKDAPSDESVDLASLEEAWAGEKRPVRLQSACVVACTLTLCFTCLGLGWRLLIIEVMVDGSLTRLALLAVAPALIFVSLVSSYKLIISPHPSSLLRPQRPGFPLCRTALTTRPLSATPTYSSSSSRSSAACSRSSDQSLPFSATANTTAASLRVV
jgi:hypothetical protein